MERERGSEDVQVSLFLCCKVVCKRHLYSFFRRCNLLSFVVVFVVVVTLGVVRLRTLLFLLLLFCGVLFSWRFPTRHRKEKLKHSSLALGPVN